MYVLPIGNAAADDAGSLSPNGIKQLLVACCEHFDIVVIDTGPILGSLEASIIGDGGGRRDHGGGAGPAAATGREGDQASAAIGAKISGIVFNRAEQRDFEHSVASTSIRSVTAKPSPRALLPETEESSRFGPLAYSVASCRPGGGGAWQRQARTVTEMDTATELPDPRTRRRDCERPSRCEAPRARRGAPPTGVGPGPGAVARPVLGAPRRAGGAAGG